MRRLRASHPRSVTREGHVVIASSRYCDQSRNVADCLGKLHAVLAAVDPPKPRRPTRPTRTSAEELLHDKRERAEKKRMRENVNPD